MFLMFCTGSYKIDPRGVENTRLCISCSNQNTNNLPKAFTCSSTLDLPMYPTQEILNQKILKAVHYGSKGFAFGWKDLIIDNVYCFM